MNVRFMNSTKEGNHIRNEQDVESLVNSVQFSGLTPLGTSLQRKVIDPFVVQSARSGKLRKPVLIITITDGEPTGEPKRAVHDAIMYAMGELDRDHRYGKGVCPFQFAQVGSDMKAREFLGKLDDDPIIGDFIDCTSSMFRPSICPLLCTDIM